MSAGTRHVLDYSWLHDDLEEELAGAEWHQSAIRTLVTSLKTLADDRHWPWHVGDQVTLLAWKPDQTGWRPAPDVVVYPQLGPEERQDIDVRVEGPPALIVEVASASTWAYDTGTESIAAGSRPAGKVYGYVVGLGVSEYLVFDPHEEFIAGQCRAWRRVGDEVQEWQPESDGLYHSAALNVSFRPEGPLLRVLDPDGRPVPFWFEAIRRLRALEQDVAALRAELDRIRGLR